MESRVDQDQLDEPLDMGSWEGMLPGRYTSPAKIKGRGKIILDRDQGERRVRARERPSIQQSSSETRGLHTAIRVRGAVYANGYGQKGLEGI